jgi:hypothetical protein
MCIYSFHNSITDNTTSPGLWKIILKAPIIKIKTNKYQNNIFTIEIG